MKSLYFLFCITLFISGYNQLNAQCGNGRYHDAIFSTPTTPVTVTYGNAMKYDSTYQDLMVDLYMPTGDNLAHRPLLLFAFGGNFTAGIRQSPDLVILCTYFAQRGYVCASIDYRLGYNGGSTDSNQFMALMRATQDMKAAVRFFYKDAGTTNTYRIDTNQIFIGGVSAGAFAALNYAYLKQDTLSKPQPSFAIPVVIGLGGPDGNSGNPGYSQKVKGVIDLCGGIADTVWIMPGDPMMVGVHGTNDNNVACYYDSVVALGNSQSRLFGGGDIKNRLSHITMIDSFYLFQGAHHVPFIIPYAPSYNPAPWMDSTEWIIRDFLFQNITCDPTTISNVEEVNGDISVSVFPNPSNDAVSIYSHQDNELQARFVTLTGQLLQQGLLSGNSVLTLAKKDYSEGVYLLQISDKKGALLKTERIVFY